MTDEQIISILRGMGGKVDLLAADRIKSLIAERDMLRTGDTCARHCEGTAYRIELQRLRREIAAIDSVARPDGSQS